MALLEQAAIAGALTPDAARATAAAPELAARLNAVSLPTEQGWVVSADGGLTLSRTVRGVAERYTLDAAALRSAEARWLADRADGAGANVSRTPARLKLDAQEVTVAGPASAFDRIIAHGRRGLTVQRFKGLGEMNPDQLWQTTLDPAVRTLLQVKVGDVEDAAQVFSHADGRRGGAAARVHRRQCAEGGEPGRVTAMRVHQRRKPARPRQRRIRRTDTACRRCRMRTDPPSAGQGH